MGSQWALDKPAKHVQVTGDGSPIVIRWQRPESDDVGELPGDVDDKIRYALKVNGHGEPDGEANG